MMNISPIVNSVKCTVFSRFAQFSHGLEGSTADLIKTFPFHVPTTCAPANLANQPNTTL